MTKPSVTYPLDLTGINPDNFVQGEKHLIVPKKVVAIAPIHGAFYAETMQVKDSASGRFLTAGRDYFTAELHVIPTSQSRKDVCSLVLLTDPTVGTEVSLSYQAVAGEYSDSDDSLAAMLNSIDFDARNPAWPLPVIKSQDVSDAVRRTGKGSSYTFEFAVQALNRIHAQLLQGNADARSALFVYLEQQVGKVTTDVVDRVQFAMSSALAKHIKQADPHGQYFKRGEVISHPKVRRPINKSPANNTADVSGQPTVSVDQYGALYRVPQQAIQVQFCKDETFTVIAHQGTAGAGVTYTPASVLDRGTRYYWRARFQNVEGDWSDWSTPTSFVTANSGVVTPSITSPASGGKVQTNGFTLTASAFSMASGSDTYKNSDWEIWSGPDGTGTKVYSAYNQTGNTHQVPANVLANNTTYYPRILHRGQTYQSAWSGAHSFKTEFSVVPAIGEAYQGGFFAGTINLSDGLYGIVLAPKASGDTGTIPLITSSSGNPESVTDSAGNTTTLAPGAGAAGWANNLTIGGYTDWWIPAKNVLDIVVQNLHPAKTDIPAVFQAAGSECLRIGANYWSSTTRIDIRSEGYYEQGAPIYGPEPMVDVYAYQDFIAVSGQPEAMGIIERGEYSYDGMPTPECPDGQTLSNVSEGVHFGSYRGEGESPGPSVVMNRSWRCNYTIQTIIGYEQGPWVEDGPEVTYYEAYALYILNSGYSAVWKNRTDGHYARAVRLVKL